MDFQIFKTGGKPNVSSFNNVNFIVGCYHTFCIVMLFFNKKRAAQLLLRLLFGCPAMSKSRYQKAAKWSNLNGFSKFQNWMQAKTLFFQKCKHFVSCNHRFCTIIIFSMIFVMRNCPSAYFLGLRPCLTTGTKTASKGSKL